jgi:hypothetical protein
MLSALHSLTDYHQTNTRRQLQLILPAAEVPVAMDAIEHCYEHTCLPWQEISPPYLQIIVVTGKALSGPQLQQLLEWAPRLAIDWAGFVSHFVMPYLLRDGLPLLQELNTLFHKEAA